MAVRVNQSVLEVVTLSFLTNVRVCQSVIEFVAFPVPLSITCGNPPQGQTGVAYSHTFPVSGGLMPYTFAITAGTLPPGLSLNSATGVVSGTPTAVNVYPFTIQVTDLNLNSASVNCSITIQGTTGIIIKITFRGVKRVRICEKEPEVTEVPEVPSVERAV